MRTVGIFRALQLGDMLCAIPALRALRASLPSAHITLIGLPWAHELVGRYRMYLDDFLEFPGWPGLPEQPYRSCEVANFLQAAQQRKFDLLIQLHGNGNITNGIVALLGAGYSAGFRMPGGWCPEPSLFIDYPEAGAEICRLQRLLDHLGIQPRGFELEFSIAPGDRERVQQLGLPEDGYVCVHPGARATERRWPREAFASIADALAARGLPVVLTGSMDEVPIVASIQAVMQYPALNLAGRTDLGMLAAVVDSARLVVCNDTGISHLADATHTPSVVVFTASDPARWAPMDRDLHRVVMPDSVDDGIRSILVEAEQLLAPLPCR